MKVISPEERLNLRLCRMLKATLFLTRKTAFLVARGALPTLFTHCVSLPSSRYDYTFEEIGKMNCFNKQSGFIQVLCFALNLISTQEKVLSHKSRSGRGNIVLTLVIVRSSGLQMHPSLPFTAKRRSALHQETPNKGMEVETHRNHALCSHDLIWHGGAESSGQCSATAQTGNPNVSMNFSGENVDLLLGFFNSHSMLTTPRFAVEEERASPLHLMHRLNV